MALKIASATIAAVAVCVALHGCKDDDNDNDKACDGLNIVAGDLDGSSLPDGGTAACLECLADGVSLSADCKTSTEGEQEDCWEALVDFATDVDNQPGNLEKSEKAIKECGGTYEWACKDYATYDADKKPTSNKCLDCLNDQTSNFADCSDDTDACWTAIKEDIGSVGGAQTKVDNCRAP